MEKQVSLFPDENLGQLLDYKEKDKLEEVVSLLDNHPLLIWYLQKIYNHHPCNQFLDQEQLRYFFNLY